jgi:hypothetical protein
MTLVVLMLDRIYGISVNRLGYTQPSLTIATLA